MDLGKKILAAAFRVFIALEKLLKCLVVFFPHFGIDAIAYAGTIDASLDKPGRLQFFQMLADGGLRQAQFLYQVAINAGIHFNQVLNNGDPRRMGEGLHHGSQLILPAAEYV
jgi:hypothetical protein